MMGLRTGSRLHFGLFALASRNAGPWLNQQGEPTIPRRKFGGVGLMIDEPSNILNVEPAAEWSADGPLAQRALEFAQRYCASAGLADRFRIEVLKAAPQHVGLGTGTQLGFAVASALATLTDPGQPRDLEVLANRIGRGQRSAIGIYGFGCSGLIVEAGKVADRDISTSIIRTPFPEPWRIILVIPSGLQGLHGEREVEAFAKLTEKKGTDQTIETLCRIVLLGMLPALREHDLTVFGEAVYDFNRRSGEMFKDAQGGIYAHPRVDAIVRKCREMGIKGVGQSSWGPAVFAIATADQADDLSNHLVQQGVAAPHEVIVTRATPCSVDD